MKPSSNQSQLLLSRREILPLLANLGTLAFASRSLNASQNQAIDSTTLSAGDLTATIGNNARTPLQRPGYNGIWSLSHTEHTDSIFVPGIAGLNLEHIINGTTLANDEIFFEPRRHPMTLRKTAEQSAELHQPATPSTGIESWTEFTVRAPHYLDMHFRFQATKENFPNNFLLFFWASYINAPLDKSIYFLGGLDNQPVQWQQLCTQYHNDQSTIRHRTDQRELRFADDDRTALFKNISPLRFDEGLFYGNIDNMTWCTIFSNPQNIRITHSPSGGGGSATKRTSNPAWDFQWIIDNPKVHHQYDLQVRTILRPTCSRDDLLNELAIWKKDNQESRK